MGKGIQSTAVTADRLEYVDSLRGFALIGVFIANLFIFSGFTYLSEDQRALILTNNLDSVAYWFEQIFVENKFMGLFACLFGISFWLFLDRANKRAADGQPLFYRRLGWLFFIGAIHGWLLWCFDILRFYALWGLLLPLFLRVSKKTLLSSALFCSVLGPALISGFRHAFTTPSPSEGMLDAKALRIFANGSFVDFLQMNWVYDWYLTLAVSQIGYQVAVFGRLLLGLYAARSSLITELKNHSTWFRRLFIGGAIIGIAGNIVSTGHYLDYGYGSFLLAFLNRFVSELGYLGLTVAYAAGLAIVFQSGRMHVRLLSPIGRMALTCYLLQTIFGLWLFYGFMPGPHLMGKVGPFWLLLIWIVGYGLQIWFASAWLRRYRFGPAEWLWRSLTYGKIQSLAMATAPIRG
jgi:uncharacterized protein